MLGRILLWIKASRFQFITGSVIPVFVCGAMSWYETGAFHLGLWILTLLGITLIHCGANFANDFFDHLSGNDEVNVDFLAPFSGGSRMIQTGQIAPAHMLIAALLCLSAGSAVGLYIVWARGWWILAIGLIGVGSAFFYAAPPFKLGYRGIGELFIMLDFGILPALGTYYVQAQEFSWGAIAAGLPAAFLITAVLFINQFPDMKADAAVSKRHWVVRLGKARARFFYFALMLAAPLSLIGGVLLRWLPVWALIGLLPSLMLPGMLGAANRHYEDTKKLAPANAGTVAMHLLTGVLLTAGIIIGRILG